MAEETPTGIGPDDVEQVEWDLAALVDGDGDSGALQALEAAERRAAEFAEVTSAIEVTVEGDDGPAPLDSALSRLASPDRDERRRVAEGVTSALEPGLRTRGFVLNTLLHDKAVDDRLRSYPHWLASRNLSNEASDESVEALVRAVRNRYDIPQRWYRLKAQLLGLDRLADYDRAAAVTAEDPQVPWPEARDLVLDSYTAFDGRLGDVVRRFFAQHWI